LVTWGSQWGLPWRVHLLGSLTPLSQACWDCVLGGLCSLWAGPRRQVVCLAFLIRV